MDQLSPTKKSSEQEQQQLSPSTKSGTQLTHSDHVVIVHKAEDSWSRQWVIDPLEEQILGMKITQMLLKQITFDTSINKFDNLEEMLHKQHERFSWKIQVAVKNQREILRRAKAVRDIANFDQRKIKRIDEAKLAKDIKAVAETQYEVAKCHKLSVGMLAALEDIQKKIDSRLQSRMSPTKQKLTQSLVITSTNLKQEQISSPQKNQEKEKEKQKTEKQVE